MAKHIHWSHEFDKVVEMAQPVRVHVKDDRDEFQRLGEKFDVQ